MENIDIMDSLVQTILSKHSYRFKSFEEAKCIEVIEEANLKIEYDRLSLSIYKHNLSLEEYRYIGRKLTEYFNKPENREDAKARREYITLLSLSMNSSLLNGYRIEKCERPDFVLHGDKRIGIEITELTTPYYQVMERICKDCFGQGKTAEEIHDMAVQKHGRKAETYSYSTICGNAVVGTNVRNLNYNKNFYAYEILKKFFKYKEIMHEFDDFIILCSAENDIEVTDKWDAQDIIDRVKNNSPEICGFKVLILYEDEENRNRLTVAEYNF